MLVMSPDGSCVSVSLNRFADQASKRMFHVVNAHKRSSIAMPPFSEYNSPLYVQIRGQSGFPTAELELIVLKGKGRKVDF